MDLLKKIKERRSVRKFTDEDLPDEALLKIIEAGRWAPSGLNNQPWKFILIKDRIMKDRIAEFTKYTRIIKNSKMVLAVFLDKSRSYHREKDLMAIGASIQNMLLMIEDMGYGACWLGEILNRRKETERLLAVDKNTELVAVLALGRPESRPKRTTRRSMNKLFSVIEPGRCLSCSFPQ